jgi:hypothetical protein
VQTTGSARVDAVEIRAEARRLVRIATVFIALGWILVAYAVVAGVIWWVDLASRDEFDLLQALGLSLSAVFGPIVLALIVAAFGHFGRLFAMWAGSESPA